jgi:hypothetical protein
MRAALLAAAPRRGAVTKTRWSIFSAKAWRDIADEIERLHPSKEPSSLIYDDQDALIDRVARELFTQDRANALQIACDRADIEARLGDPLSAAMWRLISIAIEQMRNRHLTMPKGVEGTPRRERRHPRNRYSF